MQLATAVATLALGAMPHVRMLDRATVEGELIHLRTPGHDLLVRLQGA
ncbi:MAG TPA: hypothetical protein VFA44_07540 [Gaiellaceae bacterium]|nr:hypothetical protein [Gaiellaceae bacterium]